MKTKEEILEPHLAVETRGSDLIRGSSYNFTYVHPNNALDAMSEYAKQQSIAFAKWTAENLWTVYGNQWYPYRDEDNPIPADQLYAQFIESLNK